MLFEKYRTMEYNRGMNEIERAAARAAKPKKPIHPNALANLKLGGGFKKHPENINRKGRPKTIRGALKIIDGEELLYIPERMIQKYGDREEGVYIKTGSTETAVAVVLRKLLVSENEYIQLGTAKTMLGMEDELTQKEIKAANARAKAILEDLLETLPSEAKHYVLDYVKAMMAGGNAVQELKAKAKAIDKATITIK